MRALPARIPLPNLASSFLFRLLIAIATISFRAFPAIAHNATHLFHICDNSMDGIAARRLHIAAEEHFVHNIPGTYPRLCRLSDGSILAGFTAFEPDGTRILSIARSEDSGLTVQRHGEVTRSSGDCDNLFLLEVPTSAQGR